MKIAVFGTGYVGLVTGVCFAKTGQNTICVDVDPVKIASLKTSKSPIYEPGLEDLLQKLNRQEKIEFTTDAKYAIENCDVIFVAVGTPSDSEGAADLQYVNQVIRTISEFINSPKLIIIKSTVPVGTFYKIKDALKSELKKRRVDHSFELIFNPEFLREGCALEDCLKPNRILIGYDSLEAKKIIQKLYKPWTDLNCPLIFMDPLSAEMSKYAANAMLATKISLMNEFSRVCEKLGADIESVRLGIGSDHRIGPHFINAGLGYGGSCFPKDVSALIKAARKQGEKLLILNAVEDTNRLQRQIFIAKIIKHLSSSKNKTVTIWGVAFKPGTDDIREAPSLDIIQALLEVGYTLKAFDPVASGMAAKFFKNHKRLTFVNDQYEALKDSECLIIPTEWKEFQKPDFEKIKSIMKNLLIFDGRNIYSTQKMKDLGFDYHSIGRPTL